MKPRLENIYFQKWGFKGIIIIYGELEAFSISK